MRLRATALMTAAVAMSGCATEMVTGFSDDRNWLVVESRHFIFHFRPGSDAEQDIAQIVPAAEKDYAAVTAILDIRFEAVINYYIYTHQESNSIGPGAHADPRFLAIHQPYDSGYPSRGSLGRHEMVHVIADRALGTPKLGLLAEGLAVAVDGSYGQTSMDAWIRLFCQNDTLLPVRSMLDKHDDYDDREFYPQAGAFVHYLMTRFSAAPLKRLYPVSYEAFDTEFARLYGRTVEELESDYQQYVKASCGPD
jgi:hypothetical protein